VDTALQLLAIAGFAAVALRALIALLASLRRGVDVFLARDLADTRRQRGDITGLTDAAEARAAASRRRFVALSFFFLWAGLLIIPPLTPWPTMLYASYCVLWLLPRRRMRGAAR
jgi:hypothetical protein